jgi:ABC-type nitrate/sulfonate/bicarbonate transport system substrate-binding protein
MVDRRSCEGRSQKIVNEKSRWKGRITMKHNASARYKVAAFTMLLVLAACGSGTSDQTTSPETTAGSATTAESPTTTAAADTTATSAPEDPEARTARVGVEIPYSTVTLPNVLTVERMNEMGYELEIIEFTTPESLVQAMVAGQLDIAETNAAAFFSAVDAGLEAKAFVGGAGNIYVMAARTEFETCESLDGKAVGIHGQQSTTGALTITWFANECPEAEPNIVVVPGSENRIIAMAQGQMDASSLDVDNMLKLFRESPGEFHLIESFSELDVVHAYVFATNALMTDKPDLLRDYASTYLAVIEEGTANPGFVVEKGLEVIEGSDLEGLSEVVDVYIERGFWDPVGQMEEAVVNETLAFYGGVSPYDQISEAADVADGSFLP